MQRIALLLITLLPFGLFAQQEVSFVNENGDQFLPGLINLKVKKEYRSACSVDAIAIPELLSAFRDLKFESVQKKFPRVEPPATEFNPQGFRMADISLIYELVVPENTDILKACERLNSSAFIDYAEPQYVSFDQYTPNDAELANQNPYHFDNINAYDAWDITMGDTSVVIGITETSFDVNHQELVGNIKYNYDDPIGNGDEDSDTYEDNYAGWDMVDDDNDLFIYNEIHGTAVAAIASASADNSIGYAGIGFKCKFLPVKVADNSQTITKGYEGIQYCVEQGASVINCSWGNTTFNQTAQDIVTWAAVNNDVVLVASAGNNDATDMYYPASYNYVISVTGVDENDYFDNGSSAPFTRNDSVDVSAPGYDIYTTATFNGSPVYAPPQGGTSMAGPIVAGVAGLVRSQFPCLSAIEVIDRIRATADPIDGITQNVPYAGLIGTGRVNAEAAVTGNPCDPIMIVEENSAGVEATLYPNPTKDITVVRMSKTSNWSLQVFDASGKLVMEEQFNGNRTQISGLPSGFYLARISDGDITISKKLTVTN